MRLVLDTNEYLFAFGLLKDPSSEKLIEVVVEQYDRHTLRIPARIAEEVRRNLTAEVFREFIGFLNSLSIIIDQDFLVPFELGARYESMGLKPADAFIAAYAEYIGTHVLVTENRHFLKLHTSLPFKIMTASTFLKFISSSA